MIDPSRGSGAEDLRLPPDRRRVFMKWGLIAAGAVLVLIVLALLVFYLRGHAVLRGPFETPGALTNVPTDAGTVARGEHLMRIHACQDCHGERLEGRVFLDIPPGLIVAPNLTRGRGGVGSAYAARDWDRAVRYGVRPDDSAILPFMPYDVYNRLNDADAAALAAYIASVPAEDNIVPQTQLRFLGYVSFGARGLDREGFDAPRPIIAPAPTPEYGAYLASTTCVGCHGRQLEGKPSTHGSPAAPGLAAYGQTGVAVLTRALREGTAADGRELDREFMPWPYFAAMDDMEIAALHAYLARLAAAQR